LFPKLSCTALPYWPSVSDKDFPLTVVSFAASSTARGISAVEPGRAERARPGGKPQPGLSNVAHGWGADLRERRDRVLLTLRARAI